MRAPFYSLALWSQVCALSVLLAAVASASDAVPSVIMESRSVFVHYFTKSYMLRLRYVCVYMCVCFTTLLSWSPQVQKSLNKIMLSNPSSGFVTSLPRILGFRKQHILYEPHLVRLRAIMTNVLIRYPLSLSLCVVLLPPSPATRNL